MSKAYYFLMGGIGVLCLVFGVKNYFDEQATFTSYEPATATVTRWVPDPNPKVADFCPVYEFMTKAGQTRSYIGDDCQAKPDPNTVGKQQEQIYYDLTNPYTSVETKGWLGSEGSGLIVGTLGFVFFSLFWLIPLLLTLFRKRSVPATASRPRASSTEIEDEEQRELDTI